MTFYKYSSWMDWYKSHSSDYDGSTAMNYTDDTQGLIGLWDFLNGTADTGLEDGVAQNGKLFGHANVKNDQLHLDGHDDYMTIEGNDNPFDLGQGTIEVQFTQKEHVGYSEDVIISRGEIEDAYGGEVNTPEGYFEIGVTKSGRVYVKHIDDGKKAFLKTDDHFFDEGDTLNVSYSWDEDTGGTFTVQNLTDSKEVTLNHHVKGLDMEIGDNDGESWTVGAREDSDTDGDYSHFFKGAIDYVAIFDNAAPQGDGFVEGSSGDDLIDVNYDDDPEGDMIDNEDAILANSDLNDDVVLAGAGDDTVKAGEGNDIVYGDSKQGSAEASPVTIKIDSASAEFANKIYAYTIDPKTGEISNVKLLEADARDGVGSTYEYNAAQGAVVGVGIVNEHGQFLSSGYGDNINLNSDCKVHTKGIQQVDETTVKIGFEDWYNLGDKDFNDVKITVDLGTSGASFDNAHYETSSDVGSAIVTEGAGDDQIHGEAGDDTLYGEGGNDTIDGGADDDLIDSGDGNDSVIGGDGNDTIFYGTGTDTIEGGAGDDLIDDADKVILDGADVIDAGDGNDTVYSGLGDDTIEGGAGADLIFGEGGDDIITGGSENDSIYAGDGADSVRAGTGDDSIRGEGGDDTLRGEDGNDFVDGGDGSDSVSGGMGDDTVLGGAGDDLVRGGSGNDVMEGGDGNDYIDSGSGDDTIDAGEGDDTVDAYNGADSVLGGNGNDSIMVGWQDTEALPDLGYPGLFDADDDTENDRDFVDAGEGHNYIWTGDDRDTIISGSGNDTILAGIDDDEVDSGAGDDLIVGGEGADTILAGDGNDTVYAGFAPDLPDDLNIPDGEDLVTNNGTDYVDAGAGNDLVFGSDDADTILGGDGDDTIDGGIDADSIEGGAGDDLINLGLPLDAHADYASGGDDRDTFTGVGAGDTVDGGTGGDDFDTLDLTGLGKWQFNNVTTDADGDSTSGEVNFLDSLGNVTGTLKFDEIEKIIPCFTPGTVIATPMGERLVEELQVGDRVITRDNGIQRIRWVGAKNVTSQDLQRSAHLRPIMIKAGALGNGLPETDIMVSPNHRMLIANEKTSLYFEEPEVLAAAKHLLGTGGIYEVNVPSTTYIHFMFDRHEVVLSNGCWSESFQPGDYSLKGIGEEQRNEIYDLFPELKNQKGLENFEAARRSLKKHEAKLLVH
nr:Hint domain-containing protein [Donghicola eburneus]